MRAPVPCVVCHVPIPADAGRSVCLSCLDGSRAALRSPREGTQEVAGSLVYVRRRRYAIHVAPVVWQWLDAVASGARTVAALEVALGLGRGGLGPVRRQQHRALAVLFVADPDGYSLTDEGVRAQRTRQAPQRERVAHESVEGVRDRQRRFAARRRAARRAEVAP